MTLSLIIDAILILLLAVTIGFAVRLNRRLDVLRAASGDFAQMSAALAEAASRNEESLGRLKLAAGTVEEDRRQSEKLADDLRYLIEIGDGLADRLEASVKAARSSERLAERLAPARPRPVARPRETQDTVAISQTEPAEPYPADAPPPEATRRTVPSWSDHLRMAERHPANNRSVEPEAARKINGGKTNGGEATGREAIGPRPAADRSMRERPARTPGPAATSAEPALAPRSRAERELLNALRAATRAAAPEIAAAAGGTGR